VLVAHELSHALLPTVFNNNNNNNNLLPQYQQISYRISDYDGLIFITLAASLLDQCSL
jgi:hypothetical protein